MSFTKPSKKALKKSSRAGSFIQESANAGTGRLSHQDLSESVGPEKLLVQYAKLPAKHKTPATVGHVLAMTQLLYDLLVEVKTGIDQINKSMSGK